VGGLFKKSSVNELLKKLFKSLRVQKYQPKFSKKVSTFQMGEKTRRFGLISIMDKVVQRRILELLAPVVELLFYEQSFGFRSRKGSHDALKYVKSYWSNVTWIIKVNIKKHFARINHKILLTKMYNFMDQPSVELIGKFYEAGCIKFGNLVRPFQIFDWMFHGFILFPLLFNFYFHDLDEFVLKNLIGLCAKKSTRVMSIDSQEKNCLGRENLQFSQVYRKFKKSEQSDVEEVFLDKKIFWRVKFDSSLNQLYYVRYVAHFMLGYVGGKLQANEVHAAIVNYISDNLKFMLHVDEISVAHSMKYVKYLGTLICWEKNFKKRNHKNFSFFKNYRIILLNWPRLVAPLEDLLMKMHLKRYCAKRVMDTKIARALSFRSLIAHDLYGIVKSFNRVIRDVIDYYSFVSGRSKLWKIIDVCRHRCAATMASKLKLKTVTQVFQKLGRFLVLKNYLGKEVARLDAWPYNLKTNKKFNIKDFKTNFSLLVHKIDHYLTKKYFLKRI
jgi:Type II intron maturase/Reverse transcriptase (RNA-dependent DNA polymerase)